MRPQDEKSLIERAKRRDRDAVGELYRRNVDAIYRYTVHRVHDAALAEDLTAEVFIKALESIENYTDTGLPFSAWLFRIAHARVVDHWRREKRRPQSELDEGMPDDSADPTPEIQEASAALERAIHLLSDEQQQVVVLKFYASLSNIEIAHILDKTEGAIKALQHRALASLSRILEKER